MIENWVGILYGIFTFLSGIIMLIGTGTEPGFVYQFIGVVFILSGIGFAAKYCFEEALGE